MFSALKASSLLGDGRNYSGFHLHPLRITPTATNAELHSAWGRRGSLGGGGVACEDSIPSFSFRQSFSTEHVTALELGF